jgi:hypothetical protein
MNREELLEREMLERLKQESLREQLAVIDSLISFTFPSTDPLNQPNLNLRQYDRLHYPSMLHLAPSTDTGATFMMNQLS